MAPIDPGGVLFQIHQVVDAFHVTNAGKEQIIPCQKGTRLFFDNKLSLTKKRGTNAMNTRNEIPMGFQDNQSKVPDSKLNKSNL